MCDAQKTAISSGNLTSDMSDTTDGCELQFFWHHIFQERCPNLQLSGDLSCFRKDFQMMLVVNEGEI